VCYICGQPIDLKLHYLDPMAGQVDHIVPVIRGGTDNPSNLAPSHRHCNLDKGVKDHAPNIVRISRDW
jgi:5-methylcytosine-specific restriction endonuclease McrA